MNKRIIALTTAVAALVLVGGMQILAAGGARPRPQTWVDCERFDGVVTPANFDPESDPFDELYTGGNGFLDGVPLISESKPGDQDYNGGRWTNKGQLSNFAPNPPAGSRCHTKSEPPLADS